jgi:hypothetical protein
LIPVCSRGELADELHSDPEKRTLFDGAMAATNGHNDAER